MPDGEGEQVWLVAADETAAAEARRLAPFAKVIVEPFGDIWLRDTGADRPRHRARPPRRRVSASTAGAANMTCPATTASASGSPRAAGLPYAKADWILEGGAIDGDGSRAPSLTTEQCLLNPNRNPRHGPRGGRGALARDLGFERVVWLGEGLANDHTDGHVDNLARFVAPGRVAIPTPADGRSQRGRLPRRRAAAAREPSSTSSPCPRPAGSSATARSSRRAT